MAVCSCCNLDKAITVGLHCHPDIEICSDCLDWLARRRDKQARAAGPVRIVQNDPIFLVADVVQAMNHYEKLGFATDAHDATYGFAHRADVTIHLEQSDGRPSAGNLY